MSTFGRSTSKDEIAAERTGTSQEFASGDQAAISLRNHSLLNCSSHSRCKNARLEEVLEEIQCRSWNSSCNALEEITHLRRTIREVKAFRAWVVTLLSGTFRWMSQWNSVKEENQMQRENYSATSRDKISHHRCIATWPENARSWNWRTQNWRSSLR